MAAKKQTASPKRPATHKAAGPSPVRKDNEAAPEKKAPEFPLWGWE